MTSYGVDDTAWRSYEFSNFAWENMTAQSSAKDNMMLFNASITDDEVWSQNGSLTFKVNRPPDRSVQSKKMLSFQPKHICCV